MLRSEDPTTTASVPEPLGRRDAVALAGLGLVAVGIPLWMSAAAGGIGFPSNDDWVYMRGALSLFRTGAIDSPGHTAATIGQLALVQPLLWLTGGAMWVFTAYGLAMGLIAVVSTYLLARRFVGAGSAVFAVAVLLAYPGLARQMATFMTDLPACALSTLCLLLGVRWLQGAGGRLTLIASVGVGLLAVSIREFAIAAPVAILVAAWARNRADERRLLAAVSATFALGIVAIALIASSLPARGAPSTFGLSLSAYSVPAFMTLAAALLPSIALAVGRRIKDLQASHVVAGAGLVATGMVVVPDGPFIGYIWAPTGAVSDALLSGFRDQVIPPRMWVMSEQLALVASVLFAALILRWGGRRLARVATLPKAAGAAMEVARSREGPLVLFLLAYAAGLAVFGSFFPLYDRYLYPLIPPAAVLLLHPFGTQARQVRSEAFSHAALAWLALSAILIAANSFAYDATRYRAGEAAVTLGYAAQTIDVGPEWVEFHASGQQSAGIHDYGLTDYDDRWPSFRPCAVLSNSPLDIPGFQLIREDEAAYRNYLFFGAGEPLYLYGATGPGCPAPPQAALEGAPPQAHPVGPDTSARSTGFGSGASLVDPGNMGPGPHLDPG
ncbi:MAG: glycosyltransferase family 39 protein [Chloroflexi bacterium]|nr:glycosyltransferase family 39 protein [Chloroflexota bacterium]